MQQHIKYCLTGIAICIFSAGIAQNIKTTTKPSVPVKKEIEKGPADPFSYYVTNAIKKVIAIATDPKKSGLSLAAEYVRNETYGQGAIFNSIVTVPGTVENTITRGTVYRYEGRRSWCWTTLLVQFPKGEREDEISVMKEKLDSIIKTFPGFKETNKPDQVSGLGTYVRLNRVYSHINNDELSLSVYFNKPVDNTEQQAIDSLLKLYKPGLASAETAENAAKKLTQAFQTEGIAREKVIALLKEQLASVAAGNVKAAYQFLLGLEAGITTADVVDALTPGQRSSIQAMAKADVADYYSKREYEINKANGTLPVNNVTPGAPGYNGTNKSRGVFYESKYKPGMFLSGQDYDFSGIKDGYNPAIGMFITGYNKNSDTYSVLYRFGVGAVKGDFYQRQQASWFYMIPYSGVNDEYIESVCRNNCNAARKIYKLCPACGGSGAYTRSYARKVTTYSSETEMGVTHLYSSDRTIGQNDVQKIVCGACGGQGLKEQ